MKTTENLNALDVMENENTTCCFSCECQYDTGMCCDCSYHSTWQGDPWCDKANSRVDEPTRIKACFTR